MVNSILKNPSGSLHIPLALLTLMICSSVLTFILLMNEHKNKVQLQLNLDRCIGALALDFKRKNIKIENTNLEMKTLRASLVAGNLTPVTAAAIRASIVALSIYELGLIAEWNFKRISGNLSLNCPRQGTLLPLPELPWSVEAPDSDGPKPLARKQDYGLGYRFQIWTGGLKSGAKVYSEESENTGGLSNAWKSKWASLD
jgi:hypothetical protein